MNTTVTPINLIVNQIVTGKVSRRKDRNAKGLLIEIAGNPMAYLPIIALVGRNRAERDARFASLVNATGSTIEVAVVSVAMETVNGVAIPRIKLSESKVYALREEAARNARQSTLIDAVAAITIGAVVNVTINSPATTSSDKDGSQHCFGAFVDIAGIKGLMHVSEMVGDHPKAQRNRLEGLIVGSSVEVEVLEARVEDGRAFVRVSEKSLALKKALNRLPVGSKVSATVIASDVVGNEHGLILNLGGIKGFLPEADANVNNIESLTKTRGQTVKVTITAGIVEGMVKVTRKGN
ncbi:hypothetical protein BH11CYA1_BH11CYA1_28290 [soil metagenome]